MNLIARVLIAAIFLVSGVRKAMAFGIVAGMMAGKGFPMPAVFLAASIVLDLVGGVVRVADDAGLGDWSEVLAAQEQSRQDDYALAAGQPGAGDSSAIAAATNNIRIQLIQSLPSLCFVAAWV